MLHLYVRLSGILLKPQFSFISWVFLKCRNNMKNLSKKYAIRIGFLLVQSMSILNASATVVDYPIPPGLRTSPDFILTADGKSIWVERIGSDLASFNYALYGSRSMEDLNVANFSCSGQVTIKITATVNIDSFQIRPKSRNIITQADGHTITFQINGPQKLYIEVNGLPHLAIFANPLEADLPKAGGQEITYFGPGKHNPGIIHLKDNQSIYIAGGAVVNADITGKAIKNVKIDGRGILNGKIAISRSSDIHISGIFIRRSEE